MSTRDRLPELAHRTFELRELVQTAFVLQLVLLAMATLAAGMAVGAVGTLSVLIERGTLPRTLAVFNTDVVVRPLLSCIGLLVASYLVRWQRERINDIGDPYLWALFRLEVEHVDA